MKTIFNHFKSIFEGNKKLYGFIEFLTSNYVIENKAATENPVKDGYDICFLAYNNEVLQEVFDKYEYKQLMEIASKTSERTCALIPLPVYISLVALDKFEEAGVLDKFLLTEK
ncbi:hypothetical protein V9L05_18010 [Bernardetia sp. Wsw4-3y2]|uniref:hypothetical protein n=1 Tax=Bernardetia sp. Wsw4-3y2 TaxID=3127471 RepID=UPI0030CCBF63